MNRHGHCVPYEQMTLIHTAVAVQQEHTYDAEGLIIPQCIVEGKSTRTAADNNDLMEETIDGKNTMYRTNMIVIQRSGKSDGHFGINPTSVSKREKSLGVYQNPA